VRVAQLTEGAQGPPGGLGLHTRGAPWVTYWPRLSQGRGTGASMDIPGTTVSGGPETVFSKTILSKTMPTSEWKLISVLGQSENQG
jgi:hypothetical protein